MKKRIGMLFLVTMILFTFALPAQAIEQNAGTQSGKNKYYFPSLKADHNCQSTDFEKARLDMLYKEKISTLKKVRFRKIISQKRPHE